MREGWQNCSFEDVVKFVDYRGKTPTKTEAGIRLITAKNVKMGYIQINPMEFVDPKIYGEWMTRGIPKKGDVLFTTEAPLGNVAQLNTDEKVVFAQRIIIMQPNRERLDSTFLKYMLLSNLMQDRIHEKGTGATVKGIKSQLLKKIQISFPRSLLEQTQIVAILDEAFEGIDRAIANTEKNLTNARELFESYLNEIFTQKGDGWVEKRLSEIGGKSGSGKISTGPFGSILHKSDYVVNGIPIVNPANIEGDEIIPNFNKTIDQDMAKKLQSYILKKDDVVVGRRGEIGRCAVVREEQSGWLCGSGSFFIKPFENVDSLFLAHLIRSATYRNKLEALSTGATMLNLSNQSLSDLIIGMPSLDEQNQITDQLDDLKTETQRLETIYRKKIDALNELKQSILQKAFTGELTADTANQAIEAAEENRPISKDCVHNAETIKQNAHQSGQLTLWA